MKRKLYLFAAFLPLFLMISLLFPPKILAITATTEKQIQDLAKTIQVKDQNTLTGTLGTTAITFIKKSRENPGALNPNQRVIFFYEAQNLDCNGEKATINLLPSTGTLSLISSNISAKYLEGGQCKSPRDLIAVSVSTDTTGNPVASTPVAVEENTCDAKLTSPVTWIICPIIELGIGMTDKVFSDFIKPLMEDVPVSSNPADGSYKAWQQFRLIGNIVLVGAMIAVVYAQVKGG